MRTSNLAIARIIHCLLFVALFLPVIPALASEDGVQTMQVMGGDATSAKYLGAALAFGLAAIAAGYAVGRAGSAGLAGIAERPEMRTTAIIITALGEALAIYGIVIAIMILGQA